MIDHAGLLSPAKRPPFAGASRGRFCKKNKKKKKKNKKNKKTRGKPIMQTECVQALRIFCLPGSIRGTAKYYHPLRGKLGRKLGAELGGRKKNCCIRNLFTLRPHRIFRAERTFAASIDAKLNLQRCENAYPGNSHQSRRPQARSPKVGGKLRPRRPQDVLLPRTAAHRHSLPLARSNAAINSARQGHRKVGFFAYTFSGRNQSRPHASNATNPNDLDSPSHWMWWQ